MSPPKVVAVLGLFALLCLAVMFMLPRKVYAAEQLPIPLPCQEPQKTAIEKTHGDASHFTFHDLETLNADSIMYFEAFGMVWRVYVRKGCLMTTPAVVDYAVDRGQPTSLPVTGG